MMMLPVNPMRAASAVPGAKNQDRFIDQHWVRAGTTDLREIFGAAEFSTFSTSGNGQQLFSGDR
jgi:hypothetical protein